MTTTDELQVIQPQPLHSLLHRQANLQLSVAMHKKATQNTTENCFVRLKAASNKKTCHEMH